MSALPDTLPDLVRDEPLVFWTCPRCGGQHYPGESGNVHVTFDGLWCRRCTPLRPDDAPDTRRGARMRRVERRGR